MQGADEAGTHWETMQISKTGKKARWRLVQRRVKVAINLLVWGCFVGVKDNQPPDPEHQ
jgi:hypothetical protein